MIEPLRKTEITNDVINTFIEGTDPQLRIVNLEYKYTDDKIKVYYRDANDVKHYKMEPFYPFVWATRRACLKLCGGDRPEVQRLLREYGIAIKTLDTRNNEGEVVPEIAEEGYIFMFQAKRPMSYQRFSKFFKEAGNPLYSKSKDDDNIEEEESINVSKSDDRQYLVVTPQEQFMIANGKRFFKGYEDYDEIIRMIFDLETEGLDPRYNRINQIGVRFNRPVMYKGKKVEFERILTVTGSTKEERDASELHNIKIFLSMIQYFHPDVITAHNGENFDWNFIITRCERLGTSIEEICESLKMFDGETIRKNTKDTVLKLGGEVETFKQTIVPGSIVTDSLHAVRRAQAIDSSMLRADLKYVTEYSKMKKVNRVYVPGDKISDTWYDVEHQYAFNNNNGDWYCISSDKPLKEGYDIVSGKYIVERYLLDDLWECDKVEHRYNTSNFMVCKMLPLPYSKCCTMGTAGQWKSIMMGWSYENGLAIPPFGEGGTFTGGLSRLLKVGFIANVAKFDYNSLYPSIILTWGISDKKDLMGVMLKFLEYVLSGREKYKGLTKKAKKEAERIKEKIANKPDDVTIEELEALLRDFEKEESANDKKQLPLKIFGNSFFGSYGAENLFPWGSKVCAERTTCTGRMCLRLMIYHFSTIIPNKVGGDKDYAYQPIVGDTDGFNFQLPTLYRYNESNPYIGKGLNRNVKEGKEYTGFEADVAEFNDLYMRGKMGLGIDEIVSSTINFSRKNYADYFPENPYPKDVKLVGNTIKSKKMPIYISKFLDKGIRHLLQNNGRAFLDEYYSYIEKIYNYQIPLKDIATKGKVKKNIKDYIKDCKTLTKAGRPKSRQAWMELAIKEGLDVKQGETLYYVNIGKTKSQADVKKVAKYYEYQDMPSGEHEKVDVTAKIEKEFKVHKKENKSLTMDEFLSKNYPYVQKEDEIILNARLLPPSIVDSDTDVFCEEGEEYNSAKYIDMFNKRITPLLVCFSKDIRNKVLITNPEDRPYFTDEEAVLTSGQPNKDGDQDTYEELMTMEDKEIRFWKAHPEFEIPFLSECDMNWDEIVGDYDRRMEEEELNGIKDVRLAFENAFNNLSVEEKTAMAEDGDIPKSLSVMADVDPNTGNLISKKFPECVLLTLSDMLDCITDYNPI